MIEHPEDPVEDPIVHTKEDQIPEDAQIIKFIQSKLFILYIFILFCNKFVYFIYSSTFIQCFSTINE